MIKKVMISVIILVSLSGCRFAHKISADMDRRDPGSAPILSHSEELSVGEWENKYWPKRTEVITYNFPDARIGVVSSDTSSRYIIPSEQKRVSSLGGFSNYNQRINRSLLPRNVRYIIIQKESKP